MTPPYSLQVLGPPRLEADGAELLARRRKELSLLAYLALRGRPVPRARLAAAFWGERDDERARHSLRQSLVRLKEALPGVIEVDAERAGLAAGSVAVDAAAFEADVAAGRWADAVERWRGELLAGCESAGGEDFAAWLDAERARLGTLHAAALRRLADDAMAGARWREAAEWAARWAEARPLDADAATAWVRALSLAGRTDQAAARHAEVTARWREALGDDLPVAWQALGEGLLRVRPAGATAGTSDAPPPSALLPPERVGRAEVFAALAAAWSRAAEGAGVAVVVEGEPGSGRTRLGDDFAASVRERGEAWICAARGQGADAAGPWSAARELLAGIERAPGLGGAADWALAETARLVPALRERFRALPPASGDDGVLPDAVARVLADVAAEVPVLVWADDAAAADDCSRRLILALARRPPAGAMVLLSGRPGELDVPGAERHLLLPLSPGETEALVAGMLGDVDADDRARIARRVHAASGGVPGRAVERVRSLAADGTLARGADGRWTLVQTEDGGAPAVLADAWSFVARAAELRRLEEALDAVVAGSGRVVWIAGEAGIGKTALLRELARRAARNHPGVLAAFGECDAYAGPGSPYLPFREIWRAVRQGDPAADGDPFAPEGVGGSIDERCTAAFRRAAAARPLLLVVDDAQWADAASAGLLFHLSRRVADVPLLLVAAYRDVEVSAAADHPLAGVVAEWERLFGGAGIHLDPLRDPDGAQLVDALLDGEAEGLSPGFRDALLRHTAGHPLFVVEAVRDLQARGVIVRDDSGRWTDAGTPDWGALPARVEGVIGERVRRLDAEQRRLLAVAAVEGEVFTAEVAAEVLGVAVRDVVRRLGELDRAHRLVAPHTLRRVAAGTASEYRFRHSLFHRHAATLADAAERRYLHADAGAALERLYGEGSSEAAPRLARHFAEAHDDARAARYLHLAGSSAAQAGAHETASDLFRRALEHAARAGDAGLQARVHEAAADVRAAAGDPAGADAEYRALLDEAGEMRTRVRLLRKQGDAFQARQEMEPALDAYARAEAALFEAAEWESADFAEWAQLQVGRARALLHLNRMDELQRLARAVIDGVERYGRQRTAVLATLLRELSRRERLFGLDALVAACRKFAADAAGPGRLRERAGAEFTVGFTQLWRGRLDEAEAHLSAALAVAEEAGEAWRQVLCFTYLALTRRLRGDVEAAMEWTRRARASGDVPPAAAGMAHATEAWAALRAGDPRRAAADAETALRLWSGISPAYPFQWAARWPLLAVALAQGQTGDAIAHARAMQDPEQHPLPDPLPRALSSAVESWERGDADAARANLHAAMDVAREGGFV